MRIHDWILEQIKDISEKTGESQIKTRVQLIIWLPMLILINASWLDKMSALGKLRERYKSSLYYLHNFSVNLNLFFLRFCISKREREIT